jgi:putative colanic acid biosynthesis glycosyltransferase WcaI
MKIILLCSIFPPEPYLSAEMAQSIANKFSEKGHQVTVVTGFPNHPGGKIYHGYKGKLFSKVISSSGIEIIRCFTIPSNKSSFVSRFIENITFGFSSAIAILFMLDADLIFSDTWPVFATGMMSIVARLRRIPYILNIVDLYPESIVSQERLGKEHWAIKLMRRMDKSIAQNAKHLIVLSNSFLERYQTDRKILTEKMTVIPVWVENELDRVDILEERDVRLQFSISEDDFLVVYGGNIGVGAGVETLISASAMVEGVRVLIAGGGSELNNCQKLAGEIAPHKISFYTPWPIEKTRAVYQSADVLVLPTHKAQSYASIPSKMVRYMLSGRPIIASALPESELANLIELSGCGWIITPDDPSMLAEVLVEVKQIGKVERNQRGQAGREFALQNFTATNNLQKIIEVIEYKGIRSQANYW